MLTRRLKKDYAWKGNRGSCVFFVLNPFQCHAPLGEVRQTGRDRVEMPDVFFLYDQSGVHD